jgi:hypothetical protein
MAGVCAKRPRGQKVSGSPSHLEALPPLGEKSSRFRTKFSQTNTHKIWLCNEMCEVVFCKIILAIPEIFGNILVPLPDFCNETPNPNTLNHHAPPHSQQPDHAGETKTLAVISKAIHRLGGASPHRRRQLALSGICGDG